MRGLEADFDDVWLLLAFLVRICGFGWAYRRVGLGVGLAWADHAEAGGDGFWAVVWECSNITSLFLSCGQSELFSIRTSLNVVGVKD